MSCLTHKGCPMCDVDLRRRRIELLEAIAEAARAVPPHPSPGHRHMLTPGWRGLDAALLALKALDALEAEE